MEIGREIVGVLVLIGVVVGGGVWGWIVYSRPSYTPYVVDELANVRLGMPPVEVSLARGEPQSKDEPTLGKNDKWKALWRYQEGEGWLVVQFSGSTADELTVFAIVKHGGRGRLLTLDRGDSEQDVIKKLGEPTSESIRADGLSKIIFYEQWSAVYEITQGKISALGVSKSKLSYHNEYGDDPEGKLE